MSKRKRDQEPPKMFSACGEDNGKAKLTSGKVVRIRKLYATRLISAVELGRVFGVHHACINRAINRVTWAQVK